MEVFAEEELGYEVELELVDLRPIFEGLADGEYDAFLDVWLPAHRSLIDEIGGGIELSKEPWHEGVTEYGVAAPDYMEDVRSLEDPNGSRATMITGIEPGALLMERIGSRVIPEYDLDLALVESSTPALLPELQRAYASEGPLVFLAWSPHWMNARYSFHYLEDPKETMRGIADPSELHFAYRESFADEDPVSHTLLDSMRLDEEQVSELELEILEAEDRREGVRAWLSNNRSTVEPWLDSARVAEEG